MALPSPTRLAGRAVGAAWRVSRAATGLAVDSTFAAAGVAIGTAMAGVEVARMTTGAATSTAGAVLNGSTRIAGKAAATGVRLTTRVVTGSDPVADGGLTRLKDATSGMFEPELARRTRRVWATRGRTHVELAAPAVEGGRNVSAALRRQLERLEGVEWAAVNEIVGRVLVAFDDRRISVEDVVGVVTAIEQARGGRQVFPQRDEHPGDLEPLVAAVVTFLVDSAAVGVAFAGKLLPVPALTRHATVALALLDAEPRIKRALVERFGATGTDLVFTGASALLHSATQSPSIPALNAAAAAQRVLEVSARRAVWRRREPELCRPDSFSAGNLTAEPTEEPAEKPTEGPAGKAAGESIVPPGERPVPLPAGPIESYRSKLGPIAMASALGLLGLTRRPSRSADLLKGLTPKAAVHGREAFAAVLDLLMCRRGVLPMDGSAYRRLDRLDAVVLDGDVLCSGQPAVLDATGTTRGWDDGRVWLAATRLLGGSGEADLRMEPAESATGGEVPGGQVRRLVRRGRTVGRVTIARELDPLAEALLTAARAAGHRLVITEHAGITEVAGMADEIVPAGVPLAETVRRLQADGHGVLAVSADDSTGLMAADVGVAVARPKRPPAWGADLVTEPGLGEVWRLVNATVPARRVSERAVSAAINGNVLGGLLAAVGSPRSGQRKATTPGKAATVLMMAVGTVSALRLNAEPLPAPAVHTPWHALEPEQVLRRLADVPRPEPDDRPSPLRSVTGGLPVRLVRMVAAEVSDPLTPVLATGATAMAILGELTDAALVGSVMVGNAVLSGVQRLRAETALESLLLEQEVVAHRGTDGGREDVPAGALRVGDVLLVETGDVVPADARLLEALDLEVDESNLTGESLSVAKSVAATPGAELADRTCMLFDGTTVVAGKGRAVVVAVGSATQAGRAAAAAAGSAPPGGVHAQLAGLTRAVLPFTLAGGAAVTALGVLWRRPLREAVAAGVAVAVAAVPEGLPLVATVAQLGAARRLSRRGVVVRSPRVLDALGRVDTVCFDKTGTLTENRLRVVRLVPLGASSKSTGSSASTGSSKSSESAEDELLAVAVGAAATADEQAHETDRAVVEAASERGVLPSGEPDAMLPFAAGRGLSAAVRDGRLLVKGAPEVVLGRCVDAGSARRRVRALAGEGLRVLAIAERSVDEPPDDLDEAAHELTLRGLVALADTVRPSSAVAVEQLRAAGVRVLVMTGDHPQTAGAIAGQAGIPDADRVVTGAQFARANEAERERLVCEAAVFARLSPEQKVSVVEALRRCGAVLAMTGDGVNDAAAIRLADVGIGLSGAESPAARRSADLVLTDVDLTRLVDAIAEGRSMWSRVRDAVSVLVGGNAGEIAFTVVGTALGGHAPLGTRQLLLVNLLTDMFPAMAVAVATPRQPADQSVSAGPLAGHPMEAVLLDGPHRGFTSSLRRLVVVRGAATAAGATGAWLVGRVTGPRGRASTMGLAALITTQLGQTAWAGRRSPLVLLTAAGSFVVLVAAVQTPGVTRFFGCTPLDPLSWLVVLGWAAAGTAGAELLPQLAQRLPASA